MKSQYEGIFAQILDPNLPNPTLIVNNSVHLPRLRAGLNRVKKGYKTLADFTGADNLTDRHFKYVLTDNKTKVTVSLVTKEITEFILCE